MDPEQNNQNQNMGGNATHEQNTSQGSGGDGTRTSPVMDFTKGNNNTIMAAISYIGPLVVFSYLMGKNNEFVRFHAKQGMVVFGLEILVWILGSMLYSMWVVMNLLNLVTLVLSIMGIVNVIQGQKKELPVVGGWAKNINF